MQVDPPDQVDVLVAGGRVAGSAVAIHLARAGVRVAVVDRARFPSDTLSTHVFQGGAISSLQRLGVLDAVLATGAPPVDRGRVLFAHGDDRLEAEVPMPEPEPGLPPMLCVRRIALDDILHDAAGAAGATLLDGWSVAGLVREGDRVVGARLKRREGSEHEVGARLVLGADGRTSAVARHVGAADYAVLPTERFGYFAYYEGVAPTEPPVIDIVRDDRLFGFGMPADAGLYLACLMAPAADHAQFVEDVEAGWEREVARLPRVADRIAGARRVGRPRGLRSVDTFLRDAAGPGWALLGDAGHFKDPAPGQGIADALRQAERLAEAIAAGLRGADLDARLDDWWRWRDRDALSRHTWAHAFGAAGPPQHVLIEAQREILRRDDAAERFWGPSMQSLSPREALGAGVFLRAAARAVARRRLSARAALAELAELARRERAYRRAIRTRRPPERAQRTGAREAAYAGGKAT